MKQTILKIQKMAVQYDYVEVAHQENICMISFERPNVRINIYYSRMTVATCIDHPKKGKTQLFRKNVNFKMLEKIFTNPRQHTGKGYYLTK